MFAGQISLQISGLMPVDEKSAINSLGKFNRENVTVVEQATEDEEKSMGDVAADSGASPAAAAPSSLYSSVWGLQRFFVDPLTLKQPAELASFHRCAGALLQSLESRPLDDKQSLSALVSANGLGVAGSAVRPSSFPKYLTGPRLLDLQLHDPLFRRSVLMQVLIFLAHLLNPAGHADTWKELVREATSNGGSASGSTQPAKGAAAGTTAVGASAATTRPAGSNAAAGSSTAPSSTPAAASASVASALAATSVSGAFLPVAYLPPLRALFVRALHCLRSTPPAGSRLNESFLSLLARENRFWIQWKDQRCAALERPAESAQTLSATIAVEELAQAKRNSKAGTGATTAAAAPTKDAANDASARKRKADALSSSSGPFKGFAGRPSARATGDSAAAPTSGSPLSRAPVMGTAPLARLFLPTDDRNTDVLGFLSSEDRDATPNLRFAFIQTLVDEEQEHAERVREKEERNKTRQRIAKERQERKKVKEEATEGNKEDTQPAANASMDDGADDEYSAELAELDEADAADAAADRSMLKCESRKAWQLLRLLSSTAQVAPSWLSGAAESMDDDAIDSAATLSGIDLSMRSEGQITKIVDYFTADRKRVANAQAIAAATATSAAAAVTAAGGGASTADEDLDLVAEANRMLEAQREKQPTEETPAATAAAVAASPAHTETEAAETDEQPAATPTPTTDTPTDAAAVATPEADAAAGVESAAALTPMVDDGLGEPSTDAAPATAASVADPSDSPLDNDDAQPHKKQKHEHAAAAPSESNENPLETDAAALTAATADEGQAEVAVAADASTPVDDADAAAPLASSGMND